MITGHGGNIKELARTLSCSTDEIVDMSSNLNPLGAPEKIEPFYQKTRSFIKKERQVFIELLNGIHELQIFDSSTYFVLARLAGRMKSDEFCYQIGMYGVLIRDCANFEGLSDKYVRFSLKTREDNLKLASLIKRVLQDV